MKIVDERQIEAIATGARVVAVLGAHTDEWRPAFYVPESLHRRKVRILPVNPTLLGESLFDEPVRASLAELREPVDVVDVFRRSGEVAGHVADILAMSPLPKAVWLQSGIRDDASAELLARHGIDVVQDRCLMVEAGA
jgi:uncharacterized protein